MIKELHEEAEKNRAFIDNIKANKQDFIDSWFLNEFKSAVDNFSRRYLEDDIKDAVKAGETKLSENFLLFSPGLLYVKLFSEEPRIRAGVLPHRIYLKDFRISREQFEYLTFAGVKSYAPSLNGIKVAYEYWLNAIKNVGLTVEHADEFELSEKEYKKLMKGFWSFGKTFTVKLSF